MDQKYLKERLHYDPATGVFTWLPWAANSKHWNARYVGTPAGSTCIGHSRGGYVHFRIRLDKKLYVASRLAWLYMAGVWPAQQVDHINHDSTDTRWANLREVSFSDNMKNRSKPDSNTSGVVGVSKRSSGSWVAYITHKGRRIHGGDFASFDDAVAKRKELEKTYGFHPNHGATA